MAARPAIFKAMHDRSIAPMPDAGRLGRGRALSWVERWRAGTGGGSSTTGARSGWRCAAGVPICMGGDVGVFAHGTNAREMELMQAAGMPAAPVLIAPPLRAMRTCFGIDDKVGSDQARPARRSGRGRGRPDPRRRCRPQRQAGDEGRPDRSALTCRPDGPQHCFAHPVRELHNACLALPINRSR